MFLEMIKTMTISMKKIENHYVFKNLGVYKDLEKIRVSESTYYQKTLVEKDNMILLKVRQKDSLLGVIVARTDRSVTFEQLKKILDIKGGESTIIIRPKK